MDKTPQKLERYLTVRHFTRPIKFLYFVDKSPQSNLILDSIFDECYRRWAGCRSLLVPITDGKIERNYFEWIKWYDPDVVYSYSVLSEDTIADISKEIRPTKFLLHQHFPETDPRYSLRPEHGLNCISSLSVLPDLLRLSEKSPKYIISAHYNWPDDGFIKDNFGTIENHEPRGLYSPLVLVPENLNPHDYVRGEKVKDATEILKFLNREDPSKFLGLAQLANKYTFIEIPEYAHQWCEGLNLFLGDSVEDRMHFWNSRLLASDGIHSDISSLRLPVNKIEDESFIKNFSEFLNRFQYRFPGTGGERRITVRSYSLEKERCENFINKIKENKCYLNVSYDNQLPIPSSFTRGPTANNIPWNESRIIENPTEISPEEPKHFFFISINHLDLKSGQCAVDIMFERYEDHSIFSNACHWWLLPKKNELTRLFVKNDAKVNKHSLLSLLHAQYRNASFNSDIKPLPIQIYFPDDRDLFQSLLNKLNTYARNDIRYNDAIPSFGELVYSDKGRALRSVIQSFEGISSAYGFISHSFWRAIIENLSSFEKIQDNPAYADKIKKSLQEELGEQVVLQNEEQWKVVSKKIIRSMYHLPEPYGPINYRDLKNKRSEQYESFKKTAQSGQGFGKKEAKESVIEDFNNTLSSLVNRGIFYQGHEWACYSCGNKNWTSVDNLKTINNCEVCGRANQLGPIEIDWQFLFNKKIAEALFKKSIFAELWTLGKLLEHTSGTFYFVPQSKIFQNYKDEKEKGEIDILCVRDGKLILGEAKQRSSGFNEAQIKKLLSVAELMKPDLILFSSIINDADITPLKKIIEDAGFKFSFLSAADDREYNRLNPWSSF